MRRTCPPCCGQTARSDRARKGQSCGPAGRGLCGHLLYTPAQPASRTATAGGRGSGHLCPALHVASSPLAAFQPEVEQAPAVSTSTVRAAQLELKVLQQHKQRGRAQKSSRAAVAAAVQRRRQEGAVLGSLGDGSGSRTAAPVATNQQKRTLGSWASFSGPYSAVTGVDLGSGDQMGAPAQQWQQSHVAAIPAPRSSDSQGVQASVAELGAPQQACLDGGQAAVAHLAICRLQ